MYISRKNEKMAEAGEHLYSGMLYKIGSELWYQDYGNQNNRAH